MKLNRNDLCWCGSGKKYKKCHYDFDQKLHSLQLKGFPIPKRKLIKSQFEYQGIKKSCQLTSKILDELTYQVKPGVTTNQLNTFVYDYTLRHNALPAPLNYKGFPKSICTSINEVICHGIPEDRVLIEGDIINIDVTCILNGFFGDSCRMYCVGDVSNEAKQLIEVTKTCLDSAIGILKPFDSLNVLGREISRIAAQNNYSVVEKFGGHGIGKKFHEDPFVYHYDTDFKQMICAPGMVFTIEPMINMGVADCKILKDGWTAVTADGALSAQWEHTVFVSQESIEILT